VYNNQFLDTMINRPVPMNSLDPLWEITLAYNMRPDLLAFDMYRDGRLWWVFAQRNPNTLKDPLFDFVPGVSIFLPQFDNLKTALGL
jgi:hypothetical protein